ncbi:MAG: PAS domain-containing protein, partial [Aeromicrobium sp.]|nr:PAS domain-containing protein [Burkholderiales bacterium]
DFSQYKPSTVNRRIARRMAVHQIETIDGYVKYLQQTPPEVEALFRDLLIGVTNFFRDPEAFAVLEEQIIPKLFEGKPAGATLRVWSTGCSTGEEAYSMAIMLQERIEALKQNYTVQVFATDIDSRAIATARAGVYPASIAADMTPERLARFFSVESNGSSYRIHKSIREMLVFSEQDVIKDPPFSKLDLISCRNLMIYLGAELQKKLIPLFHFALKPGGILFLGTSEGIGEFSELFTVLDRKCKVYERKEYVYDLRREARGRFLPPVITQGELDEIGKSRTRGGIKPALPTKLPLRELTEQAILQQLASASALVNARGDILYLHGRSGMYLELMPGETGVSNILKMAREGLRRDLTLALQRVVGNKAVVRCFDLNVKTNGHFTRVNLTVSPLVTALATDTAESPESDLYLVILQDALPERVLSTSRAAPDAPTAPAGASNVAQTDAEGHTVAHIEALEQQLRAKQEYLQTTQEELESSNEELKASNEEMQSVNEELQSTNEELETSKEELQSVNEELATVNVELQTKVVDLSRANNDMNNLLAGTGVGTVFVDHQLRIMRFTPAATTIINLINSDLGRPVAHIVSNLVGYTTLVQDLQEVLNTLIPKEVELQAFDGRRYSMRIQPYRTVENVIEGAVISFVDITKLFDIRDALHQANDLLRLAVVVRDAHDAITVQDLAGRILAWNPGAVRMYGWSEVEALLMNVHDRIPENLRSGALAKLVQLGQAEVLEPYRSQRIAKDGSVVAVSIISTALLNETGQLYAIATTERSIQRGRDD